MKKSLRFIRVGLRELFWVAVAGGVVFGGISGFKYLGKNREIVESVEIERPVTLVETSPLIPFEGPLPIRGEGFIKPFRIANLASQVSGQIIGLHPAITEQGLFKEGEVLVRLDSSAELATLTQTVANIEGTQARLDLNAILLERTESLRSSGTTSQAALDQVRSQKAELLASLNSLLAVQKSAEVALRRTTVTAPFDGTVLNKTVEIGTVVNGGQKIAEIFTQDRMEIDVPVRDADAALIPGLFKGTFPAAIVEVIFAGQTFKWDAHVSRVAPDLDARTRTLTLTVELDQMIDLDGTNSTVLASGAPPALINSFSKVVIKGMQPKNTYPIPSTALRGGSHLWLFNKAENADGGVLQLISAQLVHVDGETSYVSVVDLDKDARLILTALSTPQDGMRLVDVKDRVTVSATQKELD